MSDTATAAAVNRRLKALANRSQAAFAGRFFKTGPGEYGEGDRFLGLRLPQIRTLAREYETLPLAQLSRLLESPWHEVRLLALIVMVRRFATGTPRQRGALHRLYLRSTDRINNWDLVDCSAGYLVGAYFDGRKRDNLLRLARSRSLWERRIAIIATFHTIRQGQFGDTLAVSRVLLHDRQDLIHKAVGWMLREVGKQDRATLERFLDEHAAHMPRTMLRYAIERLPPRRRVDYMRRKRRAIAAG